MRSNASRSRGGLGADVEATRVSSARAIAAPTTSTTKTRIPISDGGSAANVTQGRAGLARPVHRDNLAKSRLASALHTQARMTRFDRFWEPFLVLVAAVMIWIGTL
jgi:hypothetical protein